MEQPVCFLNAGLPRLRQHLSLITVMGRKIKLLKSALPALALFLCFFSARATDEKYASAPLRGSNNQIAADSSSIVQDTVFYNLSLRPVQTTFKVRDFVVFKIDEFANLALPDTFRVTISFKVYFSKLVGGAVVLDSSAIQTVYVEYNKFRNYQNKATYTYSGGYRSEVKILTVTSSSSSGTFSSYKNVLMLENQIVVTREYAFNVNSDAVQAVSGVLGTVNPNSCTSAGEYVVNWGDIRAADEYDLEWAYIDSAAISNYYIYPGTSIDPKKVFANNATRVSITAESYEIPLLFDNHGYLFYRVRSVQIKQSGQRIASTWSSNWSGGLGSYEFMGHERLLNWQSAISFAEEGKRKAVVQYFDGTLRNRQTVTKDNTTCYTVVAESMYDFQGRPVIQVLPAPTLSKLIGYTPGFNNDLNGNPYDKTLFDADTITGINNCNAVIAGMDTGSGASKYYSPANSLVNTGFNKFIPDAKYFPFTETRYTPDNTGRIAMQGGVGKDFQINAADAYSHTHETKYFYGGADQEELDALFGTEAGNASHYSKNMVKDANGQYSVSYVDMHGRTVATALVGKPESQLDTLLSSNNKTIVKNLLDTSSNLITGHSIIAYKNLVVSKSGLHRFIYSLTPDSISIRTCDSATLCYDCLYDLDISISNDCSNAGGMPIIIHRSNLSINGIMDTSCNANVPLPALDTSINLSVGTYTITKTLAISETGLARYNEIFLRRNTCRSLQNFIDEQKTAFLASIECFPTCQSCTDSLGTWEVYRVRYMLNNNIPPGDSAGFRSDALLAYNEQRQACDALCNQTGLHNSVHEQMVTDMTYPFGQYAIIDSAFDVHNIFHTDPTGRPNFKNILPGTYYLDEYGRPDSIVVDASGKKLPPTDQLVTTAQFAANFKPGWAETLLPLHPEYGQLRRYEYYGPSFLWDDRFQKIETFKQAVDSGFLNPYNITQGSGANNLPASALFNAPATANRDPFFTMFETSHRTSFTDSLFKTVNRDGFLISAWSIATIMAHCDTADRACITSFTPVSQAFNLDTACRGELDFAWRYFRQIYFNKKAQVMDDIIHTAFGEPELLSWQNRNFPHLNLLDGSIDIGAASAANGHDSLAKYINDNCHRYVSQWLIEMAPCNLTQADTAYIIPRLIGVCKAGGDQDHVLGSSTTKPGTYFSGDSSFIQVLKDYLGARYDSSCNAYLLTAPNPYGAQPPYSNISIYDKPDSCQCEKLSVFYQQFRASGETSFSGYVSRITGVTISQATLDSLRMLCNGEISCRFLTSPLILPPALQCNVTNKCIGCTAMDVAYHQFQQAFPGIVPAYDNNDSMQQKRNLLFENFMNYQFGFAKSYRDYLDFMDTCKLKVISDSAYCDNLESLLATYQNNINNQHIPHYDSGGCDTSNIKIINNFNSVANIAVNLADWMHNGVLKVPFGDTISRFPSFIYSDTLCVDSAFIYESRVRMPVTDSGYAHWKDTYLADSTLYGTIGQEFFFNDKSVAFILVNGKYFKNIPTFPGAPVLHDSIYLFTNITENDVSTTDHVFLSTGIKDLGEWLTLRTEIKNNKVRFLINGIPLDSGNITGIPALFYSSNVSAYGPELQLDRIKMYDKKNRLRYFEDFNGCDKLAKQTLGKDCNTDCSASFTSYYNSQMGTAFSYAQIDSVYFSNCGIHPEPCYKDPVDCNQLKQVITDYYNGKYNMTHDSTGYEKNVWSLNYSYVLRPMTQYNLRDFVRNGILSTPDSVTQASGDFRFGFSPDMCLGNEFSLETRIRSKPGNDTAVNFLQAVGYFVLDNGTALVQFTDNSDADGFQLHYSTHDGLLPVNYYDFSQAGMHGITFPDWRTVTYTWKQNKLYVYVDGNLAGKADYPGNFNTLQSFTLGSWYNGAMDIDYVKIRDRDGNLKYSEDFTDYTNFSKVPYEFICPPINCQTDFTGYFNQVFATSYNYNELVALYKRQCGIEFESCGGGAGPTLCGELEPVFPDAMVQPLTACADSTLFSDGVGTLLYNAYHDSLVNSFNNRYLGRCLQAGAHETFTVAAPISEFHYTLYYYDQAGNLVKTIPPAGVNVSKFAWARAWSDSVKRSRAIGAVLTPAHTLQTQYRYNTLNQVIAQATPDAGNAAFWYDRLGRLVISQNASQKFTAELNSLYSYTMYDYLGRITEVGQVRNSNGAEPISNQLTRNNVSLTGWFNDRINFRGQMTQTVYDVKYPGFLGQEDNTIWQRNLRNRVSYTCINDTAINSFFTQATFYSYDIHGNVDTLLQDYGSTNGVHNIMNIQTVNSNRWKRMVYRYDLISGKVNTVAYQPPRGATYYPDMFYHRYSYDAENRLTLTETSMDSVTWEKEARYEYYRHGPLARTVTGEQLVQGTDYAYTLQGWLKGVNSTGLDTAKYDMGGDGKSGSSNQYTARDALGFNLHYFIGDYKPINATAEPFAQPAGGSFRPLFNGNISSMAVNIGYPDAGGYKVPMLYNYQYDQLNRLTGMTPYHGYISASNSWNTADSIVDYRELISYDANGNILKYLRNGYGGISNAMDSLTYNYYPGTNRLKYVRDQVADNVYTADNAGTEDINNQTNLTNYGYNGIGNLTGDVKDSISSIKWNVYGKITEIKRQASTARPVTFITFTYDAAGNRISKRIARSTDFNYEYTWYVRDATGNVMATYYGIGAASNSLIYINYSLKLTELDMYGSSRLGLINRNTDMKVAFTNPAITTFERGNKFFELSNHLGNVLATISDKKLPILSGSTVMAYNADVVTAQDYYPGGMQMPGRKYSAGSSSYRYSINGQEKEKELNENITAAEFWEYDSRIGRRWNVDPLSSKFSWQSPYDALDDNPINKTDPTGASTESTIVNEKGKVIGGKIDGDKGVYMVKGLTEKNFNLNSLTQYKKTGTRIGETYSEYSFQSPTTGKWLGQINFNNSAETNLTQATKTLGNFMLSHSRQESITNYMNNAGNFKGAYDLKTLGIPGGQNSTPAERDAYAYGASFASTGIIMTRRDQGNFFAGRASKMLGLTESVMLSGFGAYQANNNHLDGFWNKTKIGLMSAVNWIDQQLMGAAINGTPMNGINVKPVFHDDKVSEDLQRAGYNQYKH